MTVFTHPQLLCPHCGQRPAAVVVEFPAQISPWDYQDERVISCTTPVCQGVALAEAEANTAPGFRPVPEPLTRAVAEDITGDHLSEVA